MTSAASHRKIQRLLASPPSRGTDAQGDSPAPRLLSRPCRGRGQRSRARCGSLTLMKKSESFISCPSIPSGSKRSPSRRTRQFQRIRNPVRIHPRPGRGRRSYELAPWPAKRYSNARSLISSHPIMIVPWDLQRKDIAFIRHLRPAFNGKSHIARHNVDQRPLPQQMDTAGQVRAGRVESRSGSAIKFVARSRVA